MQSQVQAEGRPKNMTIVKAAQWIHQNNGFKGFYRGAVPRIGIFCFLVYLIGLLYLF